MASKFMLRMLTSLSARNIGLAAEIAGVPKQICGYGHVKDRHLKVAKERENELLGAFRAGKAKMPAAIAAE